MDETAIMLLFMIMIGGATVVAALLFLGMALYFKMKERLIERIIQKGMRKKL